ncbi:MAG: metallophosphoesterase [Chloroflexi bacterium]|nr:metallophosphoesterase [Chloroflexota bacterium]
MVACPRIGLIGDTEGSVPAIEATIAACRAAGVDMIVHAGDIIATPFSPDPPGETIEIVRREGLRCVLGNNDRYLADWGTSRWEATVATRRARPDRSPDYFLPFVEAGQAELPAGDLAWLRSQPEELVLDVTRPADVYVCHGMPGNPFNTIWPRSPSYDANVSDDMRLAALGRPELAQVDLILCGHALGPHTQLDVLPNGRQVLVVRASGWPDLRDGRRRTSVALLTAGAAGWRVQLEPVMYTPRDPHWRWDEKTVPLR